MAYDTTKRPPGGSLRLGHAPQGLMHSISSNIAGPHPNRSVSLPHRRLPTSPGADKTSRTSPWELRGAPNLSFLPRTPTQDSAAVGSNCVPLSELRASPVFPSTLVWQSEFNKQAKEKLDRKISTRRSQSTVLVTPETSKVRTRTRANSDPIQGLRTNNTRGKGVRGGGILRGVTEEMRRLYVSQADYVPSAYRPSPKGNVSFTEETERKLRQGIGQWRKPHKEKFDKWLHLDPDRNPPCAPRLSLSHLMDDDVSSVESFKPTRRAPSRKRSTSKSLSRR